MSLFDDSVQRLRARVASFDADMLRWDERTSEQGNLPQHRTQFVRLHDYLGGMLDAVVRGTPIDPRATPPFDGTVDEIPDLRRGVGSVHLVWDFFRDKLSQRDTGAFADHLGAADDLAWACYEPFLRAATRVTAGEVREPPLVFYSTDRTPFAQARTKSLHPPGLDSKDLQVFEAALQRLPVPVIGMPWDIANRMPETSLIGHEVGHVIAEDLHLAEEAESALRDAAFGNDPEGVRKKVWSKWCDEIFADVIGVLATGSAFVEGLMVELAGASDEIHAAPIDVARPGRYPTRMLRVALCERLLALVGTGAPTTWTETYGGIAGPSTAYAEDVDTVATALMNRSWAAIGGKRLTDVLPWDAGREADAHTVGTKELKGQPVPVPFDIRTWVAASMHAYREDPVRYAARELDQRLAGAIIDRRRLAGTRSSTAKRSSLLLRERGLEARSDHELLQEADRLAGADLARQLGLA
jgi:hypothetical protein